MVMNTMDRIYLYVEDGAEWEDIIVYLTEEDAINISMKWPNTRVEIFNKSPKGGYRPSYTYFLNGVLVKT